MRLVSTVASFALSILLIFYNIHLLGGHFYIIPRMAYGFFGFALLLHTMFDYYEQFIFLIGGKE